MKKFAMTQSQHLSSSSGPWAMAGSRWTVRAKVWELVCFSQHCTPTWAYSVPRQSSSKPLLAKPEGPRSKIPSTMASLSLGRHPLYSPAKAGLALEMRGFTVPDHIFYFFKVSYAPRLCQKLGPYLCQASQRAGSGNHTGHKPDLRSWAECPIRWQMAQRIGDVDWIH